MSARKMIDWTFIKPLWEEGMASREIARQYCSAYARSSTHARRVARQSIDSKASQQGWKRALVSQVMSRIKEKLLQGAADGEPLELSDEEVVERAASKGANVVQLHREDIKKLRTMEQELLDRLAEDKGELRVSTYQGEFFEKQYKLSAKERSEILKNLAFVQHRRITLERQAWGLDEEGNSGGFDKVEVYDN